MEVVDKIEEKKIPELTKEKSDDLFVTLIRGKDVVETIKTSRGEFKIKFPRAKDIESIGRLAAYRLNGIPAKCFDMGTYSLMQEIATLDVMIISGPDWYELAKKENENFSWAEMPSQSYIEEVYALAYEFRSKVQKQIESNKKPVNRTMAADEGGNRTDEPGLFEDISG